MAQQIKWWAGARVALKENESIVGVVMNFIQPAEPDGCILYLVRWEGFGQDYGYLAEALIDKKEKS